MKRMWMQGLAIGMLLLFMIGACVAEGEQQPAQWTDFVVTVNGVDYALPVSVSVFAEAGWTIDDPDTLLMPMRYMSSRMSNGKMVLSGSVANLGIDDHAANDCMVVGVGLDDYDAQKGATLTIAGYTLGCDAKALREEWGEPTREYEGSSRSSLTYEAGSYKTVEIGYNPENMEIISMHIKNITTPTGYNDAAYKADVEVPESVIGYIAPEELGSELASFTFQVNGKLFQIPAPVKSFEEAGWTLDDTTIFVSRSEIEGGIKKLAAHDSEFGWTLRSGAQALEGVGIHNDSGRANIPENCMVSAIRFKNPSPIDVLLPGGITLESSMEEIEKALEGQEYEKKENGRFVNYNVFEDGDTLHRVSISFDTDTEEIMEIEFKR